MIISTKDLPPNATMAHVLAAAGIFPSATQARKNGFNDPISLGDHLLTKKKIPVTVVDRELTEFESSRAKNVSYRPDLEPGFYAEFTPPTSHVLEAIQYPLDAKWQNRVLSAVYQDVVSSRIETPQK